MDTFPTEVDSVLRASGWWPERHIDTEWWLAAFEAEGIHGHAAARNFLAEFGGLAIAISGPGISCAREPFELDPMLCLGEGDRFLAWSEEINKALFPVGELDGGRFFLGIDELSELYIVETWIASFGRMPDALNNLIRGVQPVEIHGRSF